MGGIVQGKIDGLFTSPNPLSCVPAGSLLVADNCCIQDLGTIETRPGFAARAGTFGTGSSQAKTLNVHRNGQALLLATGTDTSICYSTDDGVTWTALAGSDGRAPVGANRLRLVSANDSSYAASRTGLLSVGSDLSVGMVAAGVPAPGFVFVSLNTTSFPWMATDRAVAYRATLVRYRDGITYESKPSGRTTCTSRLLTLAGSLVRTGGATVTATTTVPHALSAGASVVLVSADANFAAGTFVIASTPTDFTFTYAQAGANVSSTLDVDFTPAASGGLRTPGFFAYLPPGTIAGTHFVRVYRSKTAVTSATVPDDELRLCYELPIAALDITNGYVSLLDTTPESMLGPPLYTDPNLGEGINAANDRPPLAWDAAYWQDRLWLGNTTSKHRAFLQMLGVGAPNGVQVGDTFVVGGRTYTAISASPTSNSRNFKVYTTGTPTQNILNTCVSFLYAIQTDTGQTSVTGFYLSTDQGTDVPGQLMFEEQGIGGSAFTWYCSRSTAFAPTATASVPVSSSNDANQHWVCYSKIGEPESFPLLNYIPVGSKNSPIRRIMGFRDRLYVFKDEGIFIITGGYPYFNVTHISGSRLIAPESLTLLNESLWGYFNSGVGYVTDSGVTVVSQPIDADLRNRFTEANQASLGALTFGVGQEAARRFILFAPMTSSTVADTAYVYNIATNTWTRWLKQGSCAMTHPSTGLLYFGRGDTNSISVSRGQGNDPSVYADEETSRTISAVVSSKSLTLTSVAGLNVGDALTSADGQRVWVRTITGNTVTFGDTASWTTSTALTSWPAISSTVAFNGTDGDDPSILKTFTDVQLLFGPSNFRNATITLTSDKGPTASTLTISTPAGFGFDSFGDGFFGGTQEDRKRMSPLPVDVAQASTLYVTFSLAKAFQPFRINGIRIEAQGISEKSRR